MSIELCPMQFLGLETPSFLRAQCLVSRLEDEFPIVGSAVFFHQGNVVWSQLQQEDTRFGTFIQGGSVCSGSWVVLIEIWYVPPFYVGR